MSKLVSVKQPSPTAIRNRAIQEAEKSGLLPHQWLLKVVRGEPLVQQVFDKDTGKYLSLEVYPDLEMRLEAAKACASYFAPKLSAQAIDLNATVGVQNLSDEELEARLIALTQVDAA